ncbi:hypothetical protein NT01EI_1955 [Edwardsiella ictaluri 93-146]|uniref:Uncharacterized protein n=1 Tax=Edwardsiella ictaluri (strain 93-146) TaxID=634503 RepID=C5BA10_EDWI9|nr:hypothetical protein NT01EI_1955 [Edwardsiella ictaluri 93-146]
MQLLILKSFSYWRNIFSILNCLIKLFNCFYFISLSMLTC